MFARDVTSPKPKEYVSPDGSLVLPAGRVFRQGPDDSYPGMDPTGLALVEQPRHLRLHHGPARASRLRREQRGEPHVPRDRAGRRHARRSSAVRRTRRRKRDRGQRRATSTSRTDRSSSTTRPGRSIGRIDVPERPLQILFGGSGSPHALHRHAPHALRGEDARAGGTAAVREVSSHRAAPREEPPQPCDASGPRTRAIAAARRRHRPDCCTSWARPVLVIV